MTTLSILGIISLVLLLFVLVVLRRLGLWQPNFAPRNRQYFYSDDGTIFHPCDSTGDDGDGDD
ncbi:hypothetical protein [Phaeobacter piscinae]|uniref:hypothetical protein n=1 Tax=Phaeobacter piscinae TaxID=1580596 RepID=UPI00058D0EA3|nr:hypothetical protein [Phaeobacter piscinae]UTS82835.1 hypothetical protein OL67_003945 [Phaeobacter piscinae]